MLVGVQIDRFQAVADRAGAEYREIVLMIGKQQMLERFAGRTVDSPDIRHRHIEDIVAREGGQALLARIHDDLTAYLKTRPEHVLVQTAELDAAQAYAAVTV
jgi:hypothetical protein